MRKLHGLSRDEQLVPPGDTSLQFQLLCPILSPDSFLEDVYLRFVGMSWDPLMLVLPVCSSKYMKHNIISYIQLHWTATMEKERYGKLTQLIRFSSRLGFVGSITLRPVINSSNTTPKLYISAFIVSWPVC